MNDPADDDSPDVTVTVQYTVEVHAENTVGGVHEAVTRVSAAIEDAGGVIVGPPLNVGHR